MSGNTVKKFSVDFMRDVLWEDAEDVEIVRNKIFDTSRWDVHYELVFRYDGCLWMCSYARGATEQQDTRPWEYEDVVECVLVEAVEKVVIEYEPV